MSIPIDKMENQEDNKIRLPVAMQLVARKFGEVVLYQTAYAWEQAVKWQEL